MIGDLMTDVVDAHPVWCDLDLCEVTDPTLPIHGGAHRSRPIDLGVAPLVVGEDVLQVASASLWRLDRAFEEHTYLVLESGGKRLTLPVLKAAGVLTQLAELINQSHS